MKSGWLAAPRGLLGTDNWSGHGMMGVTIGCGNPWNTNTDVDQSVWPYDQIEWQNAMAFEVAGMIASENDSGWLCVLVGGNLQQAAIN